MKTLQMLFQTTTIERNMEASESQNYYHPILYNTTNELPAAILFNRLFNGPLQLTLSSLWQTGKPTDNATVLS